jgi:drug/metabolite transporter (DMT)-like permease
LSDDTHAQARSLDPTGLLNLSVVYVVWGSTYLAIRVAVREGSGFPPFMMGAMRVLLGGGLLVLWAGLRRIRVRLTRQELLVAAGSGLLLWFGGNGLVVWAEQRAASGYAALILASTPVWVALMEAVLDRRSPTLLLIASLLIGFTGIGVLSAPVIEQSASRDVLSVVALLGASISWGAGSVLQSRRRLELTPSVYSGYQQMFGGLGFLLAALVFGEPLPTPSPQAWLAWIYLVIIGSLFAFTAYVQALRLLPTSVVMTYAYVNPVIAVVLGWLVLGESITGWTVCGAAMVLLAVAEVFRDRLRRPAATAGDRSLLQAEGAPAVEALTK